MKATAYLIKTITDLHVGGMSSSRDIVDAVVQRDALTDYPGIHSSSLKGALRSAYKESDVNKVFGSPISNTGSTVKGTYSFSDAHMLFFPIRSDFRSYYLATCPAMIHDALNLLDISGSESSCLYTALKFLSSKTVGKLYGKEASRVSIKAETQIFIGIENCNELSGFLDMFHEDAIALLSDSSMGKILECLPVNARNYLENGISKNVWYEENVPRKSVFLFLTMRDSEKISTAFDKFLADEKKLIQIGADATVGRGFCRISEV